LTTKPSWLDDRVYANIAQDEATPEAVRKEALKRVVSAGKIDAAKAAFSTYINGAAIPDKPVSVGHDESLNHLFYSIGFFARLAEAAGSGDDLTIAAEFAKLSDIARPRRERRKLLARINRLMDGKPIRAIPAIWLYKAPVNTGIPPAPHVLRIIEPCVPWQLALPWVSSRSEYVHFQFPNSAVGACRIPNCRDAGFDNMHLWKHGGVTDPHASRPSSCTASIGLNEVIAPTPNYDRAAQPLGRCIAA
jgi:hypothetical protein